MYPVSVPVRGLFILSESIACTRFLTPILFQSPLGDYLYCQHTDKDVDRLLSLSVSVPVRGFFILSEVLKVGFADPAQKVSVPVRGFFILSVWCDPKKT